VKLLNLKKSNADEDITLTCMNRAEVKTEGRAVLEIEIGKNTFSHNFYIIKELPYPCMIGLDVMRKQKIVCDPEGNCLYFKDNPKIKIPFNKYIHHIPQINMIKVDESEVKPEELEIQKRIDAILKKFPTVARTDGKLGRTDITCHVINSIGAPTAQKPYKKSPAMRTIIRDMVTDMEKQGIIRRSISPYAAPVVLDQKKNGQWRLCIDFKKLNSQTPTNSGPMGNPNNTLRLIPTGYWYSLIDLESGYWQIVLHPESIVKSAFVTEDGNWEFLVMPFGLKNAGKTFAALMNKLMAPYLDIFVKVFMDDTLIYSKTLEEHLVHIQKVLERFKEANLTMNPTKSTFAKTIVPFLGHFITPEGLVKNPVKTEAIFYFPTPKNIKDVQRFTGLCQWYSSFIPNFATKLDPIYRLLRKENLWNWGKEQQKAFEDMKLEMCNDVMLTGLDYSKPIIVKCDASEIGLGAALVQVIDGLERPITFISKTLKKYERNAHIYEKEIYAIIWAVNSLKQYIEGHEFIIHTDNRAVFYLKRMKSTKNKLMRWANEISTWNATLVHKPGKDNVEADALSRAPVPEKATDMDMDQDPEDYVYTPLACLCYKTPVWSQIKSEQRKDPDIVQIIKSIAKPLKNSAESFQTYVMENEILKKEILLDKKFYELVNSSREDEHDGEHEILEDVPAHDICAAAANEVLEEEHLLKVSSKQKTEKSKVEKVRKLVPVIPKSLVPDILKIFHDVPEAAHLGMKKTKDKIKTRCFWVNMNKDISDYVHKCHICQVTKPSNKLSQGLLQSAGPPTAIFETIDIDFMGPFPISTRRRNQYLLVIIDELSKWIELIPMKSAKAINVVEAVEDNIFCRYGTPKYIISDNGSQFVSKIVKKMCQDWRVVHRFTSPYHPQSNQSERVNRNLKSMIQAYVDDNHKNWDEHIQKFALALRTAINETTKVTPSLLNLGRQLPLPFDRNLQENNIKTHDQQLEVLRDVPTKLSELISFVRSNIIEVHRKNKAYYDKSHSLVKFEEGELVLIRNNELSNKFDGVMKKLTNRWIGPFKITRKITDVSFELQHPTKNKIIGKRHVSDMKPYFQKDRPASEISTPKNRRYSNSREQVVDLRFRERPKVNYRTLAGYRQNSKLNRID